MESSSLRSSTPCTSLASNIVTTAVLLYQRNLLRSLTELRWPGPGSAEQRSKSGSEGDRSITGALLDIQREANAPCAKCFAQQGMLTLILNCEPDQELTRPRYKTTAAATSRLQTLTTCR